MPPHQLTVTCPKVWFLALAHGTGFVKCPQTSPAEEATGTGAARPPGPLGTIPLPPARIALSIDGLWQTPLRQAPATPAVREQCLTAGDPSA